MTRVTLCAKTQSWVVSVDMDGEDWQLFTIDNKAACDAAARAINRGIEALALQGITRYSEYHKLLKPFANLGATDTEPECVLQDVLETLGILEDGDDRFAK